MDKKYYEIQFTKYKKDLNNRKIKHHPPSPGVETNSHSFCRSVEVHTLQNYYN